MLLCRRITLIVGNASDVTAVLFPSSHFVDGVEQAADVITARRADQPLLAVDVVVQKTATSYDVITPCMLAQGT